MNPSETATEVTTPRKTVDTLLLSSGVAGAMLFSVINFSFGAISPGYDMMRQSVTDLELIKNGWIQSANYIVLGLCTCAFAIGLRKELHSGFGVTLLPLFTILVALGYIFTGIFIHHPANKIEGVFTFSALIISLLIFTVRFHSDPRWKTWTGYTALSAVLIFILLVLGEYTKSINAYYSGMFERGIIFTRTIWLFLFTLKLLNDSRLTPPTGINSSL